MKTERKYETQYIRGKTSNVKKNPREPHHPTMNDMRIQSFLSSQRDVFSLASILCLSHSLFVSVKRASHSLYVPVKESP